MIKLMLGKCEKRLKSIKTNSIDSIVTDPPYGLKFMGKAWDHGVPSAEVWREILRVLKPGGFLLSFAGTRTYHRMAVNIEDAGFEIRDMIAWVYGSGFPKSHNISKALDKKVGVKREVIDRVRVDGKKTGRKGATFNACDVSKTTGDAITDEAKKWDGWGTALKPAHEPIVVARKPLSEKTVVDNVLKHGTGGINIDGCRVSTNENVTNHSRGLKSSKSKGKYGDSKQQNTHQTKGQENGRFPANFIHDGSEEVVACFPYTKSGAIKAGQPAGTDHTAGNISHNRIGGRPLQPKDIFSSEGSASRFFYCAKASKNERTEQGQIENGHPTVKPLVLMRYLVRLVTPVGGWICDPFMGSGTTGKASRVEGFNFIGVEDERESFEIAKQRIKITVKKT